VAHLFPYPENRPDPFFLGYEAENTFRRTYQNICSHVANGKAPYEGILKLAVDQMSVPELFAKVLALVRYGKSMVFTHSAWSGRTMQELNSQIRDNRYDQPSGNSFGHGFLFFRTGGSSGGVKFAAHTLGSLVTAASNLQVTLDNKAIFSSLTLPPYHVSGFMPLVRSWLSGGMVGDFGESFAGDRISLRVTSVVPTTLYRYLHDEQALGYLRQFDLVFAGGASFHDQLLKEAFQAGISLAPCYGTTETAGMVALQLPAEFAKTVRPELLPLENNSYRVSSEGEIIVSSEQLFGGYLDTDQEIGKVTDWHTGDMGMVTEAGRLRILGRIGDFIHSGGETISLPKVEQAALEIPGVTDAVAVGAPDSEWGERSILFVQTLSSLRTVDVKDQLLLKLDRHEIPAKIQFLNKIPRTEAGKVDKIALKSLERNTNPNRE